MFSASNFIYYETTLLNITVSNMLYWIADWLGSQTILCQFDSRPVRIKLLAIGYLNKLLFWGHDHSNFRNSMVTIICIRLIFVLITAIFFCRWYNLYCRCHIDCLVHTDIYGTELNLAHDLMKKYCCPKDMPCKGLISMQLKYFARGKCTVV